MRATKEIMTAKEKGLSYFEALEAMPDRSKANVVRLSMDIVIFAMLMAAYGFGDSD